MARPSKEQASLKRKLLEINYGEYRKLYDGSKDDRLIVCYTYDMLMKALREMEDVSNSFIWFSFARQYRKELEEMDSIIQRFGL